MDSRTVIARLREYAPELRAAGIVHLRLHGSHARGQQTTSSDIDLIAEFDGAKRLSILDLVGLEQRLTELLGVKVDLSQAKSLKDAVRRNAAREAILAF